VKVFTSARAARPTREDHPAVTTTHQPAYDAVLVVGAVPARVIDALETVAAAA